MEAQWGVLEKENGSGCQFSDQCLLLVLTYLERSLGVVEAGDRCISVFILDGTESFKSPVQLLLWKKPYFLLGWIL